MRNKLLLTSLFFLTLFAAMNCSKPPQADPAISIPGYKADLIFEDCFDSENKHWLFEGSGIKAITEDNRLKIIQNEGSEGAALWINRDFSGNFFLEYTVRFSGQIGRHVLMFCAKDVDGGDIFQTVPPRDGKFEQYFQSPMRSYHITYHNYLPNGSHHQGSQIRKNPGYRLLQGEQEDPCMQSRNYMIHLAKTGNRIQFFVDGEIIHDIKDRGGFLPLYTDGFIGFWMNGSPGSFITYFSNVRVFRLRPV